MRKEFNEELAALKNKYRKILNKELNDRQSKKLKNLLGKGSDIDSLGDNGLPF